jgi:hypothetical protein
MNVGYISQRRARVRSALRYQATKKGRVFMYLAETKVAVQRPTVTGSFFYYKLCELHAALITCGDITRYIVEVGGQCGCADL